MLIGGASITLLGIAVLLVEGRRANAAAGRPDREPAWTRLAMRIALPGGLLLALSTFQGEFDFGVPQFRFVFAPMLVMLAAGVGLVATRCWGRAPRTSQQPRRRGRRLTDPGAASRAMPGRE